MNKRILYLVLIVLTMVCSAGVSQTYVDTYIFRDEHAYPLDMVEKELAKVEAISPTDSDTASVVTKVILLFRRASFLDSEEIAREAYDFIANAYDNNAEFQIPVMLAYKGSARAMIAGSLTSFNPFPKVTLLGEGQEMLDEAIQEAEAVNKKDYLTLGYLYFLRGRVFAVVPTFLKVSKEAPKSLKTALSLFKKVDNIPPLIIANVFYAYGLYYHNKGDIKIAIKNMEIAKKYSKNSPLFYTEVDTKLKEIQGE